jgi:predicted alpha/beta-fold hydrolase
VTEFAPAWFLPGPHLQTVWGRITRPRRAVRFRRESLETPDGDELLLDHLDGGGEAILPVPRDGQAGLPLLHFVLLHGLEGSSYSVYMQGMLRVIARHGYSATAINFRSCARDPRNLDRMIPNRRPRFYHSGDTADLDFVLRTLASRMPSTRFLAFGASLGGNVLLKWLGEHPHDERVLAAAAVSVPFDLGAGADHLDRTAIGRFYVNGFLRTLKKKCERPEIAERLDMPRVRRARNFREIDDAATAPLHGFVDANDYYARSSSIHYVGRITTPTLALSAEDDPFVPPHVLPRVRENASPQVDFRTTPCGGHVGFIGGSAPWRCEYWAEELLVRWLLDSATTMKADGR